LRFTEFDLDVMSRAGGTGDACFCAEFGHGPCAPAELPRLVDFLRGTVRPGVKRLSVVAVLAAAGALLVGGVAPAAQPANQCTYTDGEWVRCIQITVTMPTAPAVAATAPVTIAISSQVDVAAAAVEIDLPAVLRWSTPPTGFSAARQAARRRSSADPSTGPREPSP